MACTKATEKVCDGEFWYRIPGRELADRVGLEVELTLKNKDKLVESFEQLGRRELHQVWWVCGDKTILKAMHREVLDRRWLAPQRHYFCLSVKDLDGHTLASKAWKEAIFGPGYRLASDAAFEFRGPRSMDRFFVDLSACNGEWGAETFLVQFH